MGYIDPIHGPLYMAHIYTNKKYPVSQAKQVNIVNTHYIVASFVLRQFILLFNEVCLIVRRMFLPTGYLLPGQSIRTLPY